MSIIQSRKEYNPEIHPPPPRNRGREWFGCCCVSVCEREIKRKRNVGIISAMLEPNTPFPRRTKKQAMAKSSKPVANAIRERVNMQTCSRKNRSTTRAISIALFWVYSQMHTRHGYLSQRYAPQTIHRRIVSPGKSVTIAIMLMHGASPGMPLPPRRDTAPVESAEALEPCHGNADLKLLQADGAFRRVYAVLFCRDIGEHASRTWRYPGQRSPVYASFVFGTPRARRAAVGAVRGDAHVDV